MNKFLVDDWFGGGYGLVMVRVRQEEKKRSEGGRARAEETRRRLLDAGVREFGERGFSAVSTRELAKVAEVNLAAIPYHFDGKEGLYRAVLERIVKEAQVSCGVMAKEVRERLMRVGSEPISMKEGEMMITQMITTIVDFLVGRGDDRTRANVIIRELMTPSDGFSILYDGYMKPVHTTATHLIASLLGESPDSEESIMRTHALLGQIVFFSAGRKLIQERTKRSQTSEDDLEQISRIVSETFIAAIRELRSARQL